MTNLQKLLTAQSRVRKTIVYGELETEGRKGAGTISKYYSGTGKKELRKTTIHFTQYGQHATRTE